MDGLLTAVQTVKRDSGNSLDATRESHHPSVLELQPSRDTKSSEHVLAVLKSKPDASQLSEVLCTLDPSNDEAKAREFDIRIPSPISAQVLQVLASTTIFDHWDALNTSSKTYKARNTKIRAALLRCFSSVAGLSAIVAQLRSLIGANRSASQKAQGSGSHLHIQTLLSVLSALLKPTNFLLRLYTDISTIYANGTQRQVAWRELVSLIAAGRVLSTAAEALTFIKEPKVLNSISWIGDGRYYATWLGDNICLMASNADVNNEDCWKSVAFLTGRSLSLGYTGNLLSNPVRMPTH